MKKVLTKITFALLMGSLQLLHAEVHSVGYDKSQYTSDFMIGKVVVSVLFPESDGSLDHNTETWSEDRKTQVLSKIMSGLQWWTKQNPNSPLSFTFVTQTVGTQYEPITRPYYDESLWIPDVLAKLGYPGSRFTASRNYVNALRDNYKTDWGFVIFVVDSLVDANGKFADGLFAYAYLGGPFLVMTYDNNGYGIGNMDVVVAHETGHIFHALDEYAGASSPNDYSYGYFPTINGNHAFSQIANDPNSIMRGGIRWSLDDWARQMIGWRDNNKNNRVDILDPLPTVVLSNTPTTSFDINGYSGEAKINVLPRQGNANGYGFNVDTIAKVEYRMTNYAWSDAMAEDGNFDSADETFRISLPPPAGNQSLSINRQDIEVRAVTSSSLQSSDAGAGGNGGSLANSLDNAHAFPNPFEPNKGLGHTDITFTELTNGANIQIFTVSGEPVISINAPASSSTLQWRGVDDQGKTVASGVYYYLITDNAGNKKKGKVAIIR